MVAIVESVNIPFFQQYLNDKKEMTGTEAQEKAARSMLDQLAKWAENLKSFRAGAGS
jgi:hypothetical protein